MVAAAPGGWLPQTPTSLPRRIPRIRSLPRLRRRPPEPHRLPIHGKRLDESAIRPIAPGRDHDRDLVADMNHVARVARAVEVACAVAFVMHFARALCVLHRDDGLGMRILHLESLDRSFDRDAFAEVEL